MSESLNGTGKATSLIASTLNISLSLEVSTGPSFGTGRTSRSGTEGVTGGFLTVCTQLVPGVEDGWSFSVVGSFSGGVITLAKGASGGFSSGTTGATLETWATGSGSDGAREREKYRY